ncbi:DUF2057 domain-containing protein [Ferrimonas senticii]|uniref:DUF2057 domain-containing protein n=1 Tax=Ferrimonas senticii TaxID=394566 RepID=UPI00042339EC|nr:DUF2057 domain-containing protein [Ferrimonas senticii]
MKKALSLALLAVAPLTQAGDLNIPQEFEFVAINGKTVSSSLFSHNDSEALQDGNNKVAIIYKDLVAESIGDGHLKVKSAPFVLTFDAAADQDYHLKAVGNVVDEKSAKAFAANPQVTLLDNNGNEVMFDMLLTEAKPSGIFNQVLGQNPNANAEAIVATGGVVPAVSQPAAPVDPVVAATGTAAVATAPAISVPASQPQTMLHYWWGEADKSARANFASWAVQYMGGIATMDHLGDSQPLSMLRYWFEKSDEQTRKAFMTYAVQNL